MRQADILIIGAGPAGAIAGAKLAQEGFDVQILEKGRMPRFVIGESLLPRCNERLEEAGMLEAVERAGFLKKGGAVFTHPSGKEAVLDFSDNLGQKWGSSYQVKREVFDKVLIDDAQAKGCSVAYDREVIAFDPQSNETIAQTPDGTKERYRAKKVIDASGYGRVLPRLLGLEAPSELKLRRAVFARVEGATRPEGELGGYIFIDVVGDNEAWIWNIPFSDGVTSVGIVCEETYFERFGMDDETFWHHIIANTPAAAERYQNATIVRPVDSLSGYSKAVTTMTEADFLLTGNASEFLDPVFSSGVTLALESGARAAELIAKELKGERVDYKREYEAYMMTGVNVFRDYVNAWYDGTLQTILFSDRKAPAITRKIISILSGYVWDEQNSFVTSSRLALRQTYEALRSVSK